MVDEGTPALTAVEQAMLDRLGLALGSIGQTSSQASASNSSSSVTSVTKLSFNAAKSMLEQSAKAAGYPKQFTSAEINAFIKEFNAKQSEQIAKVVTIASSKTTPGATPEAAQKIFEQTARQEFPSFFDPAQFATDFIWKKVNYKDQTTLGQTAISSLQSLRGLVDRFQIIGMNQVTIENLAKQVAKGDLTLAQATTTIQQQAAKEYPQFADQFAKNPTLTTYDIADPIISVLADTWEMDKKEIKFTNPLVMKWMNGFTADGKANQMTKYDIILAAKRDPKYQFTKAANNDARDSATAFGSALGYGV